MLCHLQCCWRPWNITFCMFALFKKLLAFALNRVAQFAMRLASMEYCILHFCTFEKVAGVRTKPRCTICNVVSVHGIFHFAFLHFWKVAGVRVKPRCAFCNIGRHPTHLTTRVCKPSLPMPQHLPELNYVIPRCSGCALAAPGAGCHGNRSAARPKHCFSLEALGRADLNQDTLRFETQ